MTADPATGRVGAILRLRAAGRRFALPACLAVGLFLAPAARGQGCCTPGSSPLGGLSGSLPAPGDVQLGAWMESFHLDQAYRGPEKVTEVNRREGHVARIAVFARIGLPAGTALLVEWPYEIRGRDQVIRTESQNLEFDFDNRAPGDLSTMLLVTVWPRNGVSPWGLEAGAGIKWANGSVDRTDDGRFLPVELQSGTGSVDPLLSLSARRAWAEWSIQAAAITRIATTGRNEYRFGSEWNVVTGVHWAAHRNVALGADARLRHAAPDEIGGRVPQNTGGTRLLAGPRLTGTIRPVRLQAYGALLLPVRQDLKGTQLGVSRQFLVGLTWPAG